MAAAIGGGIVTRVTIPFGKERRVVETVSRMRVFRQGIGVVLEPEEYAGMIVVPRWEELEKLIAAGESRRNFRWRSEHLNYEALGSVYHAFRQTWHILAKYGLDLATGEKAKMEEARRLARELNFTILGLSSDARIKGTRRVTREAVQAFMATIGEPRAIPKREAREQILAVAKGADSRGRPNPSALMARAKTAERRIEERLEDVMAIDPHIVARQKTLLNMIQVAELRLDAVDHFLDLLLRRDGLRPLFERRERRVIAGQLECYAQELERIDFAPYRNACRETARDLREARDRIRTAGTMNGVTMLAIRRPLARARRAIAVKRLQKEIERLIFLLTRTLVLEKRKAATHKIEEAVARIETRLEGTVAALVNIDDRTFRRPVSKMGASFLRLAGDEFIAFQKGGDRKHLGNAREILKKASAAL